LRRANLRGADLRGAVLREANLSAADLREADLSGANLSGAKGVTNNQLRAARSFEGVTLPNGQKYEDWLKDRESREEDIENE
jgi:uncharacterized protein YjbI with pentapeptide repeats